VKSSAREDKRRWLNEMAGNAERAAENGRTGELHRIVKTLTGEKRRVSTTVNDKNGRPTNEGSRRLKIWKEHFEAVLNPKTHLKGQYSPMKWKEGKMTENLTLEHFDQPR